MGRTDSVSRHAVRRRLAPALVAAALLTVAAVAPASAAAQSVTVDRVLGSGSMDLGGTTYPLSGLVTGDITVTAAAVITAPIRETLAYDDGSLRQGGDLMLARTVAPNGSATVKVTWTVSGSFVNDSFSKTESCAVSLSAPTTCDVTSAGVRIFGHVPVPGTPFVDMVLQASVKVTPDSATVQSAEIAGATTIDGPNAQAEPGSQLIEIPCTTGEGDTLSVDESDYALGTHIDSTNGPAIEIGLWIPNPFFPIGPPAFEGPTASFDVGSQHAESFDQDLTDATAIVTALGAIAANNVPPNADAGGPYAGLEGVAVSFSAAGSTSICGFDSLAFRWDFSDGGVAFGATPSHTFTDDGVYSGQLTATDPTGLSNIEAFSVTIANQDPIANAGPDTTADWGRNVSFNGTATDPERATSPRSSTAGTSETGRPRRSPRDPAARASCTPTPSQATTSRRLTVTDKDGGSDTDTRTVHVTKRDTTTAYVGPSSGTFDTPTTLARVTHR